MVLLQVLHHYTGLRSGPPHDPKEELMKKFGRKLTALLLAAVLAAGTAQTAFASWALGSELVARTTQLAEGTALTSQYLWSASKSDLRTEHYITYDPTSDVKPMVFSGNYVASTNTVGSAAAQMEAQGYRVAAAINGGWFNTDGTIVGMLVTDGVVRSLDVENYVLLGFTGDGQVFIDESVISKSVSWQQAEGPAFSTTLAGFNAYRHSKFLSGLYLYNQDFSSRVNSSTANVSAVLRPVDGGVMKLNGTLELEVVSVTDTTQEGVTFNGVIPEGCYMLYAEDRNNASLLDALRALTEGQRVTVAVSGVSQQWKDGAYGISSLYPLLRGGEIVGSLPTAANPYTAVGIKADGTAIFYTIDGRQSGYSVGATYAQVAERLQELGCVSAVALDGGGSTTLGATLPGSGGFSVVNKPSGNSQRRVNNSILLVTDDPGGAGMAPGAYVDGKTQVVLAGAKLPVTAVAYDGAGNAVPEGALNWTATGGTIEPGQGNAAVYTAGTQAGTYAISASDGGGAMPVQIVDGLSRLQVSKEGGTGQLASLTMEPGQTADLTASGIWWNLAVSMDDGDVKWTADPAVGTIDSTGRFTAAGENGKGAVTATAGGKTVTIPVTVKRVYPFVDIEGHWSADYVAELHKMGITSGYSRPDGSYEFKPDGKLTRGELLTFIARLLNVDIDKYQDTVLPFVDAGSIDEWLRPYVKAMYALRVFEGTAQNSNLYANVDSGVTREEAMTMLGRVLANRTEHDLSGFTDGDRVSGWARAYVETLVSLGIVEGSDGTLRPKAGITRGEAAKLLVEISPLEKAELTPRPVEPPQTGADPDGPFVTPTERPEFGTEKPPYTGTGVDIDGPFVTPTERPE